MEKFKGSIMQVGEDTFLCSYDYLLGFERRCNDLEKKEAEARQRIYELEKEKDEWQFERAELLEEKQLIQVEKKTGTVTGKEGRKAVLTDVQKDEVLLLRNAGHSLRDIAEFFGVSHVTIVNAEREKRKEQKAKSVLTSQESTQAVEWYRGGHPIQAIAETLKKDNRAVRMAVADVVGVVGFCQKCGEETKFIKQSQGNPLACVVCGLHHGEGKNKGTEAERLKTSARATGSETNDTEEKEKTASRISDDFMVKD